MGGALTRMLGRTAGLPAAPNPTFSNVRLLCGFNGTDASTTFVSDVGSNPTAQGNAQLDTAEKKFGTASLLLDGTGDYALVADSGSWDLGVSDDFQIELFIRWPSGASFAASQTLYSQWTATGNQRAYRLALDSDGLLKFQYTVAGITALTPLSVAWAPATDVWHHVAFSRVAGVSRFFVNGAKLAETGVSNYDPFGAGAPVRIGAQESGGVAVNFITGWVDEVRFCKVVGGGSSGEFYTSDFIPPTAEFPRS